MPRGENWWSQVREMAGRLWVEERCWEGGESVGAVVSVVAVVVAVVRWYGKKRCQSSGSESCCLSRNVENVYAMGLMS